ncbi:MAG: tripartite tricarboxylate transporter substrate-binding protein [Beijerinckiaceae bacterium]|nr:tripartite tricarboxylate transporter substrate-binding protein [Beijerinckiaceae bacterium]
MRHHAWTGAAIVALWAAAPAMAQQASSFYEGKNINMYIGYSAGGGYDVYARMIARHMARHIPGLGEIIPNNMPGAGSLRMTNWLYNVAPKDGTAFGAPGRGAAFEPLLVGKDTQFDSSKFNWLGSANNEVSVCVAWENSGVKTIEDAKKKELVVGGTGGSADTDQFPKVLNEVVGTKMKLITGYPGGNDINLAMERGEVQGRCGWSWSSVISTRANWLKEGKINVLVQLSMKKHEDLPKVPLVLDLASNEEERQILRLVFARQAMGRPFMAPPDVPADRVRILRDAFMATMKDKQFLAEANKAILEIDPVSGEEVQDIVKEAYETPKAVVQRTGEIVK